MTFTSTPVRIVEIPEPEPLRLPEPAQQPALPEPRREREERPA